MYYATPQTKKQRFEKLRNLAGNLFDKIDLYNQDGNFFYD